MINRQSSNTIKAAVKISSTGRLVGAGVFAVILAGFTVLWASEHQWIRLRPILGVCGFKQRFGLPCPGCEWTHAAQAFASGRIVEAYYLQPASAVVCTAAVVCAVFSLHIAVFGIDLAPLRWVRSPGGIKILICSVILVVLGGWAVTLIRVLIQRGEL